MRKRRQTFVDLILIPIKDDDLEETAELPVLGNILRFITKLKTKIQHVYVLIEKLKRPEEKVERKLFLEAIVASESKLQLKPVASMCEDFSKDLWLFEFIQPLLPYDERSVSWDCILFVQTGFNMRPQLLVRILKLTFKVLGKLSEFLMSV